MYGKSKASLWRNLSTQVRPKKFFSTILCFVALVYKSYFFSEQPFYGNHSTLDSHTNTAHTFAYSSRWRRKPWQGLFILTTLAWLQYDKVVSYSSKFFYPSACPNWEDFFEILYLSQHANVLTYVFFSSLSSRRSLTALAFLFARSYLLDTWNRLIPITYLLC